MGKQFDEKQRTDNLAIISLFLGVIGFLSAIFSVLLDSTIICNFAALCSFIGIYLGLASIGKNPPSGESSKIGLSLFGILLGAAKADEN